MKYSLIIPVYNRPAEVDELLQSLAKQLFTDFEVIIVEDGSAQGCQDVVQKYEGSLALKYFYKENSGPGPSRNYGAARAQGEYLIFLDSDVMVPEGYFEAIGQELPADAFGGPDREHPSFTPVQKAINYSMTSWLTTGGIRGGRKSMDKFYPRSFNMGIRKDVFERLGGFSAMRFGEDIDLSIRIFEAGFTCRLFPEAWVWHKRRTDLGKFFRQVHNSGIARINLYKKHPSSLRPVHMLPALFTIGCALLALGTLFHRASFSPVVFYALLVLIDSLVQHKRDKEAFYIAILSVGAAFVQLIGYGTGFLRAWWERCVVRTGGEDLQAYKDNFYK